MLDAIRSFFASSMSVEEQKQDGDATDEIRLAACALLLELAYADEEFTPDEADHLKAAVRRQYGVDDGRAEELIALADQERARSVDLFQFTRLIRDNYSLGQKMVLLEVMWGLVYADGQISAHEQYLIRKISHLLKLKPGYLSQVKKRVEGTSSPHREEGRPD